MRTFATRALVVLLALLVIVAGAAYGFLRRSLPTVDGVVQVSGVSSPIDIIRDADAVPHIYASSKLDALFGLGYVHAQDRLWQMEFQRRIGHGRLSEIFGPVTIPQDRFLRTVGFGRAARAAWDRSPDTAKQLLNAYVAGVNAFISTHHGTELPIEFSLLRFEPEPWSGVDVMVWGKMMAWDLSKNFYAELMRHDVRRVVGGQKLAQLMPPYAVDGLNILSVRDIAWLARRAAAPETSALRADSPPSGVIPSSADWFSTVRSALSSGEPSVTQLLISGAATDAIGSNNWVVDGTLTASGRPLLANDPHLDAHMPSIWYLAHVSGGDLDVVGATLPGAPAVTIGRNRFIAWGETNALADVEDLYQERLDETGRFVEYRGTQEPITALTEVITVKGEPSVRVNVRLTRHGPLVSDAINANNAERPGGLKPAPLEPLAFRWTALDPDDTTVLSFMELNEARTWSEFTAALRDFVVPSQNFVYADVEGHIGYYAPGRIPIRAHGDGSTPAEGWSGEQEWTGWVPFAELPHTFDPPEHFLVSANNRPTPPQYPHLLGFEWTEPYRAQRVTNLLRSKPNLTPDDFAAFQADTLSLHAESLLPLLLAHARPQGVLDEQALAILRRWNRDARGDSAGSAIFQAWLLQVTPTIVGDELGPLVTADFMGFERLSFVARFLVATLASPDNPWCDDLRTPKRESCDDAVSTALHAAVVDLRERLGGDMTRWRWDGVHRAIFRHQGLDTVAVLRPLLSRSVPSGGDWSTVNVGPVASNAPYEQRTIVSYRQIIDLSPTNDNRFIDAVGESGHPLSKHYDDFLSDWQAVKYRQMRMERAQVEKDAIGHLRLEPERR